MTTLTSAIGSLSLILAVFALQACDSHLDTNDHDASVDDDASLPDDASAADGDTDADGDADGGEDDDADEGWESDQHTLWSRYQRYRSVNRDQLFVFQGDLNGLAPTVEELAAVLRPFDVLILTNLFPVWHESYEDYEENWRAAPSVTPRRSRLSAEHLEDGVRWGGVISEMGHLPPGYPVTCEELLGAVGGGGHTAQELGCDDGNFPWLQAPAICGTPEAPTPNFQYAYNRIREWSYLGAHAFSYTEAFAGSFSQRVPFCAHDEVPLD